MVEIHRHSEYSSERIPGDSRGLQDIKSAQKKNNAPHT
jgi:hypothetical protein